MSLLLDALKKAADDKKKNIAHNDITEDAENTNESLELELNLDSDIEEAPTGEDFPEVDETSITRATIHESTEQEPLTDSAAEIEPEDDTAESIDAGLEKTDTEQDDIAVTDLSDKSITASITSADDTSVNTNKETFADDKPSIAYKPQVAAYKNDATKNIATEKALLALINKSNQHNKQENLKKTITITVLVTLLLVGSGLFFYIKMNTASQEIFIADNNQAPVKRDIASNKQPSQPDVSKTEYINKKTTPAKITTPKNKSKPAISSNKSKSIHIVHSEKKDPISTLVLEAYNQFQQGNYERANKLYQQVILRESNNRDALLGLSAIAVKQQRYEFARQKYQYLLRLNPKDSIAIAGLSSIENALDPLLNESQLKFMLKEQPDAAHLYFALGSLYSLQNKWPEAQSAYFSAWSAENKNADYAYNLAISLDHLDKKDQALDFYTLSLKLKQASSGNFSAENTAQRIRTLKENNK